MLGCQRRRGASGDVPVPTNWGGRARRQRQYGLVWIGAAVIVTSYFGALVAVRALDTDEVDCSDTCLDAPQNETGTVLVIGDSILKGYYSVLQSILEPGETCLEPGVTKRGVLAELVYGRFGEANSRCGTSFGVNQCLDRYLATTHNNFSVIHFAWGLHDICENIYSPVSFDEYSENMERMYHKLKGALSPNGTLVFGTTTPVPPSYDSEKRVNSDVLELNRRARLLFGPTGKYPAVRVNDLYGRVVELCRNDPETACYPETCDCPLVQNNGVHFSPAGQRLNAISVAWHISPYASGPVEAGERDPEIEKHRGDFRWEHWKVALFAQTVLLFGLGMLATCVLYVRGKRASQLSTEEDGFHLERDRSESAQPLTPRRRAPNKEAEMSPFHASASRRAHFPATTGGGSGSRPVDEDGYANSLGGSPTPVTAFEPPLSPFSPDERRSCPVYPDTRLEIRPSLRASNSINMEEIEMTGNDSD